MIKGNFLKEPELEFGLDRHIDIRVGLTDFRPADYRDEKRPQLINIGIIGTPETVEGFAEWLQKCKEEVLAEDRKKPKMYPTFPGFNEDCGFECETYTDSTIQSIISPRELLRLKDIGERNQRTKAACDLFIASVDHLANKRIELIVCLLPPELLQVIDIEDVQSAASLERTKRGRRYNLHDMMKARSLEAKVPIQLVRPGTFDRKLKKKEVDDFGKRRQLQDDATIAWNLFTAFYYKAGGFPWRLTRDKTDLTACHVGISFYESLERDRVNTALAQIFDERGHGLIVQGGEVSRDKVDRQPRMNADTAHTLVTQALASYKQEHRNLPARIVFHKSSKYSEEEIDGISSAASDFHISTIDLVSLRPSSIRLARNGYYAPLRGSYFELGDEQTILYTNGSVRFFEEYPGLYVPRSLSVRFNEIESSRTELLTEILALTKMNWNNTQLTELSPVTLRASRQIGAIMKYASEPRTVSAYRYFM